MGTTGIKHAKPISGPTLDSLEERLLEGELATSKANIGQFRRTAEALDLIRERALLLQERLVEQRVDGMNDRLFVLAIISVIFLPLGFVTGLFGVNVGGMPGVDNAGAFIVLCLSMIIFSVIIVVMFCWRKWI